LATTWVFQGLAYGPLLPGMCMTTNKKSHSLVSPMSINTMPMDRTLLWSRGTNYQQLRKEKYIAAATRTGQ